ncbi:hypothetical protein MNB_SV-9-1104 [hydrothermal vent metagenome]|uniref:DarT domain-containing protein n=1 Tax=hydrothermal vent metagenome TaxID=652676 RepID=A0A1W1BYC6_9ZZZZ
MNLKETLEFYGITSIWHFTDESNLDSIKKHGLLSLALLTQKNIDVPCYGADELSHYLDKNKGIDKYVHLSIIPSHPMQYIKTRDGDIPNPVWLEIDVSVLFEKESLCCNQIANKTNVSCYNIDKIAEVIDLKRLLNRPAQTDPIKRAQLLVANKIEYTKIKGIYNG